MQKLVKSDRSADGDDREVDDNVTRRLLPDLEKSDWSAMIGHLLGLDHAGHLSGPHSALTNAKKKVCKVMRFVAVVIYCLNTTLGS